MTTVSEIEETASKVLTQVSKGLPWVEEIISVYFPAGPQLAFAMKIIGENIIPGLAATLHELSVANNGGELPVDDMAASITAMVKGGIQLEQHISSQFPNLPVKDGKFVVPQPKDP
jgi:hypothetical protein